MKTTIRRPSKTRTCQDDNCTVHAYPRKNGLCGAGELVIPTPGDVQALVVRRWNGDGYREAHITVYDKATKTWSAGLPLPSRPRRAHAAAVRRARQFVRSGVLA